MISKQTFAQIAGRTVASAMIVLAAGWAWTTYATVIARSQHREVRSVVDQVEPGIDRWRTIIEDEGHWQFDGADAVVRVVRLSNDEIEHSLNECPNWEVRASATVGDAAHVVRSLMQRERQIGRFTQYSFEQNRLRTMAWTYDEGEGEFVVALRAALQTAEKQWIMAELRAQPDAASQIDGSNVVTLLPMPPESKLLCVRFDKRNRRLAELILLNGSEHELERVLEAHRCEVTIPSRQESVREYGVRCNGEDYQATLIPRPAGSPLLFVIRI